MKQLTLILLVIMGVGCRDNRAIDKFYYWNSVFDSCNQKFMALNMSMPVNTRQEIKEKINVLSGIRNQCRQANDSCIYYRNKYVESIPHLLKYFK